jgi:hypothetical protein
MVVACRPAMIATSTASGYPSIPLIPRLLMTVATVLLLLSIEKEQAGGVLLQGKRGNLQIFWFPGNNGRYGMPLGKGFCYILLMLLILIYEGKRKTSPKRCGKCDSSSCEPVPVPVPSSSHDLNTILQTLFDQVSQDPSLKLCEKCDSSSWYR